MRRLILTFLFLPTALWGLVPAAMAGDQAVMSARLRAALADKATSHLVWVFFTDKGLDDAARSAALELAAAQLDPRTARRRAKVRPAGASLVDRGDLPLAPTYLAAVRATGAVARRQSRWLNAASFAADAAAVQAMAALPFVSRLDLVAVGRRPRPVDEGLPVSVPPDKSGWTLDYGGNREAMEQANVPPVHELGITGQGVVIGMLDSGFRTTHQALAGIEVLAVWDFVNDDGTVDTEAGDPVSAKDHGTMTLGTAMGFAPGRLVAPAFGARALLAKTEDVADEQPVEEDYWVAGLEWLEAQGADIVNSSLSYTDWYAWSDMDGATAVTTVAADLAVGRGLVVVNSAGNDRANDWGHIAAPADGDSVITVGAVTSGGDVTGFSSPGPTYDGRTKPDVSAMGYLNYVVDPYTDEDYRTASGTSFSSPLTAAVAALILSRVPGLTPLQVREALRETAHLAASPDNDFGWGIINAYEAVHYFGPRFVHDGLVDTEDTVGPYVVTARVTERVAVDPDQVRLWYRVDGGAWETAAMSSLPEPDMWFGTIPGQTVGHQVDYYLTAAGVAGVSASLPHRAPDTFFTFEVGLDSEPPVITHAPLRDQAHAAWPPGLACRATDNLGVDRVELRFRVNAGSEQGPFLLTAAGDDVYAIEFPLDQAEVNPDDTVTYTLTARDQSSAANSALSGPHVFQVIDALGVALILDDAASVEPVQTNADSLSVWITRAGFLADIVPAAGVTVADFQGYQAVILSSGNHEFPVADDSLRQALRDHVAGGGRLLLEGGEIGHRAHSNPGYPDFMAEVLHCQGWVLDGAGDLQTAAGMENHPVLNLPHALPFPLALGYAGGQDQDGMMPVDGTALVVSPVLFPDLAGLLTYDDNAAPQAGQVAYLAFNLGTLEAVTAEMLAVNALGYLLAPEPPPTAVLSGRITLNGETDHAGVTIATDGGLTTMTAADGTWLLTGLYDAHYSLRISKLGWTLAATDLYLAADQSLGGLDFTLQPVIYTSYGTTPGLPIPDFDSTGITSVISVPWDESGEVLELSVDVNISHPWRGDLTLILTRPSGAYTVLHNRTGDGAENLQGNYEATLTVDGPGALVDFQGVDNGGDWTLQVIDGQFGQTGTLVGWGLNFTLPGAVSGGGDDLPKATRLLGNTPNPFNPLTEISYTVADPTQVKLTVYDLRGRLVRTLLDEPRIPGRYRVFWDGLDTAGRGLGSGTYLCRLEAGAVLEHRKMLLLR